MYNVNTLFVCFRVPLYFGL